MRIEFELADNHLPALTGPDYKDLAPPRYAAAALRALLEETGGKSGTGDQHEGEQEVEYADRPRQRRVEGLEHGEGDHQYE